MDADSWSARLSSASKRYQSALQSRSDMFMGFEEIDGEDDIREEFPCPFCSEYFDIVGLCCHIDDEHPVEAKNGFKLTGTISSSADFAYMFGMSGLCNEGGS
ncbi:Drought induced 19 protein type [Theobroma cacao]|nr:Drought induced 19 protein type [Theobroma cacao]